MSQKSELSKLKDSQPPSKGLFARLFEKLDKKMEAKAKQSDCCGSSDKGKGGSCC